MHKVMVVLGLLVATLAAGGTPFGEVSAQEWRNMTSSRQARGEEPFEVEVRYGAGTLNVRPGDPAKLYEYDLRYDDDNFEPLVEFDASDRQLELGVRSRRGNRRGNRRDGSSFRSGSRATIALNPRLPLDLDLEFGAGEAVIELGGMTLRTVSISTGASETKVSFDRPNRIVAERIEINSGAADLQVIGLGNTRAREISFKGGVGSTILDFSGAGEDMSASVEMGVGSVVLRLPRGHGVRLDRDSFLTSFAAPGLERGEGGEGGYFSSNWNSAVHKLDISVKAALGSIEIEWVD